MPAQPVSRRIALGTGLGYHLFEWGAGDSSRDHTVILVHGFLDLAWGWTRVAAAGLGQRYHLIAPDMRGHGDSDWVGAGGYYHFLDYVADLEDLIGQVGRSRVSLVGHSMGGSICAYYAGTYPERIDRLAMLEGLGPPESGDSLPGRVKTWIDAWRRVRDRQPRSYASIEEAALRLRKNDSLLDEGLAMELAEHGTREGEDGLRRFKHDPLHTTTAPMPYRAAVAAEFWRAIDCPVLLIDGSESVFRHAVGEFDKRAACIANHRRVTIDGAGHMMQRHQPERVAAALLDFLG